MERGNAQRIRLGLDSERWSLELEPDTGRLSATLALPHPQRFVCTLEGLRLRRATDGGLRLVTTSASPLTLRADGAHLAEADDVGNAVDELLAALRRQLVGLVPVTGTSVKRAPFVRRAPCVDPQR